MSPLKAANFHELNLVSVIERAEDFLIAIKELRLSNEDAKALAKAQMLTQLEQNDGWESASWHLVHVEFIERCIRDEDPTCESNSKNTLNPLMSFCGGFNA